MFKSIFINVDISIDSMFKSIFINIYINIHVNVDNSPPDRGWARIVPRPGTALRLSIPGKPKRTSKGLNINIVIMNYFQQFISWRLYNIIKNNIVIAIILTIIIIGSIIQK